MAKLTAKTRNALPSGDFANPKERRFPMQDKAHVKAAKAYERYASPAEKAKIDAKYNSTFGKKSKPKGGK